MRKLDQPSVVHLLTERLGLSNLSANQLASHWLSTSPYRNP